MTLAPERVKALALQSGLARFYYQNSSTPTERMFLVGGEFIEKFAAAISSEVEAGIGKAKP